MQAKSFLDLLEVRRVPWYCCQTLPTKEFLAVAQLERSGFTTFNPCMYKFYPHQKPRLRPLFPGYVFVQFDVADPLWYRIHRTIGVKKLFSFDMLRPIPMPPDLIPRLQQQTDELAASQKVVPIRPMVVLPGSRYQVTTGHFANRTGICSWSGTKRAKLLLDLMHGEIEVEFLLGALKPSHNSEQNHGTASNPPHGPRVRKRLAAVV